MKIDKYKQSYKTYLKNYDKYEKKYKSRYKSLYKAPKGGKLSYGEFRTMYEIIKAEKNVDSIAIELVKEQFERQNTMAQAEVLQKSIMEATGKKISITDLLRDAYETTFWDKIKIRRKELRAEGYTNTQINGKNGTSGIIAIEFFGSV